MRFYPIGDTGRQARFFRRVVDFCFALKGESMFEGLLQPLHLLLIVGIVLLCFGPKKFADFGKGLGDGIRNFKSALKQCDATLEPGGAVGKNADNVQEIL